MNQCHKLSIVGLFVIISLSFPVHYMTTTLLSMLLTLVYFDLFIFWGDKIVIFLTRKTTKY